MRGPKPSVEISLTSSQRAILERWERQRRGPQDRVRRARILLMAAAGERNAAIGRAVGLSADAARLWRNRWRDGESVLAEATPDDLEDVMDEILADAPRPGTPTTFTPEQVAKIIAVACEKPSESKRPVSHWTPRELAAEVILRGIVQTVSARHVGRFLKRGGPQTAPKPLLADPSTR
jgi:transposase